MIVVGILAMPVVWKSESLHVQGAAPGGALVAAGLAYSVFYSVDEEIRFQATQQQVNATTIQRVKDIRSLRNRTLP